VLSDRRATPGTAPLLGRFVARHRRSFLFRKAAGLCRRYFSWYSNVNYDLESNGEGFVLDTLARFSPRVIFDVGANVGDWTAAAAARCLPADVHAFEISPPTFSRLSKRFEGQRRIHCLGAGLSDQPGTVTLRHFDGFEALTTATEYPHPFSYREIEARVTTGGAYATANNITHIDLLKIDVEGMEQMVLRGFDELFAAKAIDLVQFEYGRVSIINRCLLRDFYEFFENRGFRVGKIYPAYVDFRPYEMGDEDFLGPNYLACRAECTGYLKELGGE